MYETAAGFRQAIETRLNERARKDHVEVNRLRRGLVFERIMTRLGAAEPGAWVVKGGMVLEWRLGDRARATRDLDLVRRGQAIGGSELRERLVDLLASEEEDDRFLFEVGPPQALDVGFRFSVTANMAGKAFASVRLDVAARAEELFSTEKLQVPGALPTFDRLSPPQVEVAAPAQHFAEKLHALTRDHGDRLNTRVRDLVDLMLLIELALVHAPEVLPVVRHVFESRGTHPVPGDLPDPPAGWRGTTRRRRLRPRSARARSRRRCRNSGPSGATHAASDRRPPARKSQNLPRAAGVSTTCLGSPATYASPCVSSARRSRSPHWPS